MTGTPVALDSRDANRNKAGGLTYLGGLRLRSGARGFGGFSGLDVSPDGTRLIAVSDFGRRKDERLVYSKDGRLTPLTGLDGKPLTRQARATATAKPSRASAARC